jgi:molybdopterin/thiamine biosynthesis adenylyltransferase
VTEVERINALDPDIDVLEMAKVMKADGLKEVLVECTFVLDCFDGNASRLAVNRACLNMNLPACHGFNQNFNCEVFTILSGESLCLACALGESFPEPEMFSVVGAATDLAGMAMAPPSAIQRITSIADLMEGGRLAYDLTFT